LSTSLIVAAESRSRKTAARNDRSIVAFREKGRASRGAARSKRAASEGA
jgi:hypothetical protein